MNISARLLRKLFCSCSWLYPAGNEPKNIKTIFLTFDDGPHPIYSNAIMDILAHHNIKATFFLLGANLDKNREVAERMIREGHLLANHTYSHKILSKIPKKERYNEIERCQELINNLQPRCISKLFRPPQGLINLADLAVLRSQNFIPMYWTIDSKDHLPGTDIYKRLKQLPQHKNIILFHDDNDRCLEPLTGLIPLWIEQGFTFSMPTI